MIFGGPIKLFSEEEFESLQKHLERGGSLAFFIPDGGKNSNINNFLEEYGLNAESDEVIRTSYYKYFHPKHAFISNGVLHHDIDAAKSSRASSNKTLQNRNHASNDCCLFEERLVYVYPNGTTIDSQLPSIPVLSSGLTSIPINQAIAGIVQMEKNDGRVLLMGSADVFADDWIDAEDNRFLSEIFFDFLLNLDNHIKLDRTLVNTSSLEQKRSVPDIKSLSNRVKICLQEEPPLPQDLMKLYDYSQFGFGINLIPEVLKIYKALNVLHKPLTLIAPAFERPIPRLQLATFKPRMRNLSPPSLELFDLDESFADRSARITQLANKCCSDDDIEYFINDTGAIFDITQNFDGKDAKSIITYVFKMVSLIENIRKYAHIICYELIILPITLSFNNS